MTAQDFAQRSTVDELMDTEAVSFEDFRACLVDLAAVNRLTLAYRPTIAYLDALTVNQRPSGRRLRILDVGSGYGDMLRQVAKWARRRGIAVELTGVDMNPWSRRAAVEATDPALDIRWVTADAFEYAREADVDIILSSLFTHHLSDGALVRFLVFMEDCARVGWFVNDLHRHRVPYAFFRLWSDLAGYHRFVQHDGPVSIARAFSRADWERFLLEAGVPSGSVKIAWQVPFRLTLARYR
jgi:SAM-dependent methyltransferase